MSHAGLVSGWLRFASKKGPVELELGHFEGCHIPGHTMLFVLNQSQGEVVPAALQAALAQRCVALCLKHDPAHCAFPGGVFNATLLPSS